MISLDRMKQLLFMSAMILLSMGVNAQVVNNPHGKIKFECETCHTTSSFSDVEFDHNNLTSFDLEERHAHAECVGCHNIKNFKGVTTDCLSCHTDVHEGKLGIDCTRCHTSRGWEVFDSHSIHENTNFPLMGRHALVDCLGCHTNLPRGDLSFPNLSCISCHETTYLETTEPDHVAAGMPIDCQLCHQMHAFRPGRFPDHDPIFPIYNGKHSGEWGDCAECHIDPSSYAIFSCVDCHEHNQGDTDPYHLSIPGYSYQSIACYDCHPTGEAEPFIDHDAQSFPIYSGKHNDQWDQCAVCHVVPSDRRQFSCLQCHQHRQSEMDGKHGSMTGYSYLSSACYDCHPTGEKGTFVAHDGQFFPIYSGIHNAQWQQCTECHTTPSDRTQFSCFNCHKHNQTDTDAIHSGFAGYAYQSQLCLDCHPTGVRGSYVDHDAQFFPIFSGKHNNQWSQCSACHTNPTDRKEFNCFTCHKHNQTDTDNTHSGMQGYSYLSPLCLDCHPDGQAGRFIAHDGQYFPIYSGKHRSKWSQCSTCHEVPGDRKQFTCFNCHEHNRTAMDDKHKGESGYSYNSQVCYGCHADGTKP